MTVRSDQVFTAPPQCEAPDEEVVREVLEGNLERFAVLMRRYNQRLYRVCRSVLPSDGEAEDAVQAAYCSAYRHLDQFQNRAKFSTWLTKIAFHEALARKRRMLRWVSLDSGGSSDSAPRPELAARTRNPEGQVIDKELATSLGRAIDSLPDSYRAVFILRHVQGLSTEETSTCLNLSQEAVKSRLFRSRRILQESLQRNYIGLSQQVLRFLGPRCDRLVKRVLAELLDGPGLKRTG